MLDLEITDGSGEFADEENDPRAGNARAAGDPDSGPGAGAPAGPGRDPGNVTFVGTYVVRTYLSD